MPSLPTILRQLFRRGARDVVTGAARRPRLQLTPLEDRTVPAQITFTYSLGGAQSGHIGYDDSSINSSLATQNVAITDLEFTYGGTTYTEANLNAGSVAKLAYGAFNGVDFLVDTGMPAATPPFRVVGSSTVVDVVIPSMGNVVYVNDLALSLSTPAISVAMVSGATEGGSGTFRFTRTGDVSGALTVSYSVSGTATSGTDYTGWAERLPSPPARLSRM